MKKVSLSLLLISSVLFTMAQSYAYDKEKIYVQTDHVFYAPGTTIFYKIYLVKGADNKPSKISNVVYVEMLGPSGTVLEKQIYQAENGYSEGAYTLGKDVAGGIYKIKAYTSWMRNEKDSTFFTKSITVQKIIAPRVLMRLDFDKKGYGAGAVVKADFSMRNLDDAPIKYYNGQFTVSLDGVTQQQSTFRTDANGKADVSFVLPHTLQTTDGLLNISVNYDSHLESISRSIPITLNKIDLQFMPEGGSFVAGIKTTIAFKAINEFGKPVDVKGVIKDSQGETVAAFESYKFGMGSFLLTPESGMTYTAAITSPDKIKEQYILPKAAAEGVVMNIVKKEGALRITCSTSSEASVRLVGSTKSITYFSRDLQLKKGTNDITLNENLFPAGIAQFTLYTKDKHPIAERLIFLNSDKQLHVSISTNKQRYLPREKVRLTITTKDEHGQPIPSNFSLSVIDDKLWTMADDRQDNIFSWLLLSSELRGPIEEPAFYFKKDEGKSAAALDLVTLTNGYRYFDFIDEVHRNKELKFTPDEGNIVSGIVTNEKDIPVAAKIFLIHNVAEGKALEFKTGEDGQFYFSNLAQGGQYLLIARSSHKAGLVKVRLQQNGIGYNPLRGAASGQLRMDDKYTSRAKPVENTEPQGIAQPASVNRQPKAVNLAIGLGDKSSALNEVVVTAFGVAKKREVTGSVVTISGAELKAISPNGAMLALQGKVAGLYITQKVNPGETPLVQIRGASSLHNGHEPLFMVNGIPQEKFDFSKLSIADIESITVLKDADAIAIYGAKAAYGVVLVQTKTLRNEKLRFNVSRHGQYATQTFTMAGPSFTAARRFYAPQYNSTITDERHDYRETIYWNPVVQTNNEGKASVEFYNSDATTTFRAIAEGIGYNGKLGRADTTYVAKAAMSVDAKIPPYLTVGDQALIPVVIKNNSTERLEAAVDVSLPSNMHAESYNNTITLAPDSSQQLLVPITATAPSNGDIRISITSNLSNENIVLPISASGKGFPVIATVSGNTGANHNILIGQFLPGSLHAKLTLYKDLEGQLLNGIESMLREPYGCFEQTSSTTYPNVFILKYLRQSGKSNPEIERKAMGYIESGYKRLIGFETPELGFEWFGRTPAHAALTAYGLLEFTDMQEFVNVDKNMLRRTKDYLLGRRDGQGGFKPSSSGLDEFRSVPDKIANIYIVYALTQAGYGSEIQPEYTAALKKALESGDGYQLAMMALAASNMKNDADYRRLMDQLSIAKLSAETSVVNSRDVSLRVETMSLYALALMRDTHPDIGAISYMISKILGGKSYYGYGSTQGTVLALQAITQYTQLIGEQTKSSELRLTLNNQTLSADDSLSALLHAGPNSFSVEYPVEHAGKKSSGIPYNLEISYNTLTPPNSEKADLLLHTALSNPRPHTGETVRLSIDVTNKKDSLQPMAIAKIGIPAGLSLQPWQLKELIDQKKVAYYEIFDNYLVLYWMGFAPKETKQIRLDLKAEIPGKYKGKASNVYLYYTPEAKNWNEGLEVQVR